MKTRLANAKVIATAASCLWVILICQFIGATEADEWKFTKPTKARREIESNLVNCDSLFGVSDNMAAYCQCRDQAESGATTISPIAQLDCSPPNNLSQMMEHIWEVNSRGRLFQVDFLKVVANLTGSAAQQTIINHNEASSTAKPKPLLQVDHLSMQLQLQVSQKEKPFFINKQIENFANSIQATQVESLSMVVAVDSNSASDIMLLELSDLLNTFKSLSRLDISSFKVAIKQHNKILNNNLKWLNLASNKLEITFEERDINEEASALNNLLEELTSLEHLSLESNQLARFPLPRLSRLNSLNLASNKLESIAGDLFSHYFTNIYKLAQQDQQQESEGEEEEICLKVSGLLPGLAQLDLSYNRLESFDRKSGQLLLCSMPQLSQLYLQQNRLLHLNLDGLLQFKQLNLVSRLEYLDASNNQLVRVTGVGAGSAGRLKQLNLNFNFLNLLIYQLSSQLYDRVLSQNNYNEPTSGWTELNLIQLFASNQSLSLCDFIYSIDTHDSSALQNELLLSNNQLESLAAKDFSKSCKNLNVLILSNNQIASISQDAFSELHQLERLDLSGNLLTNSLQESKIFSKLQQLKYLDLSRNKIKSIDRSLLQQLTKLEQLIMSDNELTTLPLDLMLPESLTVIELSRNKLIQNAVMFLKLANLQQLFISENNLRHFGDIDQSTSSVSRNQLINATDRYRPRHDHVQSNWRNWTKHNQQNKSMSAAPDKKLSTQRKLQRKHSRREYQGAEAATNVLDLSANSIDSFKLLSDCSTFSLNLEQLSLAKNKIRELYETSFKCTPYLQRLNLRFNQINFIEPQTFSQLKYLTQLELANNKISRMVVLPEVARLHLDLSRNELNSFKPTEINLKTLQQLEVLDLSFNSKLLLETKELAKILLQQQQDSIFLKKLNFEGIAAIRSDSDRNQNMSENLANKLQLDLINLSSIGEPIDDSFLELLEAATVSETLELNNIEMPFNASGGAKQTPFESLLIYSLQNGLQELSFTNNYIGQKSLIKIFSLAGELIELSFLNLSSNRIDNLPFRTSMNTIRYLDLSSNNLNYLLSDEQNDLQFKQLEILNLSSNSLTNIVKRNLPTKTIFKFSPKLKQLDLSNNRLSWIQAQAFDNLNSLSLLKLTGNNIETISLSFITNLMLKTNNLPLTLDLSNNRKLQVKVSDNYDWQQLETIKTQSDLLNLVKEQEIILYIDESSQPRCSSINFLINLRRSNVSSKEAQSDDELIENRLATEICLTLIEKTINVINFDFNNSTLESIVNKTLKSDRFFHLSFKENSLNDIATISTNNNIISLDFSNNFQMIELLGNPFNKLNNLMSISLANNKLRQIPLRVFETSSSLTYFDLSSNQIKSLFKLSQLNGTSKLLSLKLSNNLISELRELDLLKLSKLKYIDLRRNPLKLMEASLKPLFLDFDITTKLVKSSTFRRVHFKLSGKDESALIIEQNINLSKRFSIEIDGSRSESSAQIYTIKYCSLSSGRKNKVCLKSIWPIDNNVPNEQSCFWLSRPNKMGSCMTSLEGPSMMIGPNSSIGGVDIESARDDGDVLVSNNSEQKNGDIVLDMIELIKNKWLKLKEVNLDEYIMRVSKIKSDSILMFVGDGRYPIYTVTLLKGILVIGSAIVLILLIAIFSLLTCNKNNKLQRGHSRNDSSSPTTSQSEPTTTTSGNDATNSDITNSSISVTEKSLSMGNSKSRLSTTSSGSSAQMLPTTNSSSEQTVLEREADQRRQSRSSFQALEASQLLMMMMNQQQQQTQCPTPSSSLAPSSVETAETLQAVDSIQSSQFYPPPPPPAANQVATVMRMVKSNSASFGAAPLPSEKHYLNNQYGTLSSNVANYSQLRGRLKMTNFPRQQQQVYPSEQQYCSTSKPQEPYYQPSGFEEMELSGNRKDTVNEHDPTTMSLLSLNSALSAGNHVINQTNQSNYNYGQANQNLCHYHRLANTNNKEQQQDEGVIQEEDLDHFFTDNSFPVPLPPPTRAIEILQQQQQQQQQPPNNQTSGGGYLYN